MTRIAIIPAREGSKRIANKNISLIGDKPAILLAIECAKSTGLFSEIIVSTDSQHIATLASGAGMVTVSIRPKNLSDDKATTLQVVKHEISKLIDRGLAIEAVCCIYPVTPLLNSQRLVDAYKILISRSLNFVIPVQRSYLSEERRLIIGNDNLIAEEVILDKRTQDLKKSYFDAGQFYWGTITAWETTSSIFSNQTGVLPLNKWETVDVDDPEDLELVRILYEHRTRGDNEVL
jgi:N-acylneuraminate cytidylyltransferase